MTQRRKITARRYNTIATRDEVFSMDESTLEEHLELGPFMIRDRHSIRWQIEPLPTPLDDTLPRISRARLMQMPQVQMPEQAIITVGRKSLATPKYLFSTVDEVAA